MAAPIQQQAHPEVFQVMVQGIGRIVAAVESAGQTDNTLIFFLQDNGGCAEGYGRSGKFKPRADKPSLTPMKKGQLQTRMQPAQTRDGYPCVLHNAGGALH